MINIVSKCNVLLNRFIDSGKEKLPSSTDIMRMETQHTLLKSCEGRGIHQQICSEVFVLERILQK